MTVTRYLSNILTTYRRQCRLAVLAAFLICVLFVVTSNYGVFTVDDTTANDVDESKSERFDDVQSGDNVKQAEKDVDSHVIVKQHSGRCRSSSLSKDNSRTHKG